MYGHSKTQKQIILEHLTKNGTITTMECFEKYKITRLSEYIRQLRNDGLIIKNNPQHRKGRRPYDIYELVDQALDLSFIK